MARTDPRNFTQYWHAPLLGGLSCLHADFTAHEYTPHSHQALVLAVTEIGGSEFKSQGRVQEATEADLLVFNPDEPHSGRLGRSPRWRYRGFYLDGWAMAAVAAGLGLEKLPYFGGNRFRDPELIRHFGRLHQELQPGTESARLQEGLIECFGLLCSRHGSAPKRRSLTEPDRRAVVQVQEMIRAQYMDSLQLEEMSEAVGLSLYQLIRLFKRCVGMTPHAYLIQVRLEAAIAEIRRSGNLAEAAYTAGFYDQSALTKHFKRAYGITPMQWARASRQGALPLN